jgi:hypothetical protein
LPDPAFGVDSLRAFLTYLADDRREGRGPGTAGLEAAGAAIAARFAAAGLTPAGDNGTWFQEFDATIGVRATDGNRLRAGERELGFGTDWNAYGFSDTSTVHAATVFAGYGIEAPEYKYDDYAGLDVKGKIVVVLRWEPGRDDSTSAFDGKLDTPHADLRHKAILAREKGAVGMLVVSGPRNDTADELGKLRPDVGYYSTGILCGQVRRAALAAIWPQLDLAALQAQLDAGGKPAAAPLAPLDWTVHLAKERTRLRNVLALLPGTDPRHFLILGAHYDHLGMGGENSLAPDAREVHNGADDNASGSTALVALARHFAAGPRPPMSMLFAAFSGEEMGLVGSNHFVKQPTVALDSTVAMLNMDMIGRLRDRKLQVFGTATAREFPHLVEVLNGQGPRFALTLKGDGYGPSDHMSFFKKGIPVLHFFTGAHADYHKPSDDADQIEYAGLSEVASFVGSVAQTLMEQKLTFVASNAPAPSGDGGGGGGFKTYLGSIPDYGQPDDLQGVLLSGVRAGSPADKAGIKGGDVIVQIDATVIRNIQDFVYALNTHKPGDTVTVSVLRGATRQSFPTVLGSPASRR